ncbi:MAG: T9SS type A sorting domain-containing protein [Saprospiraceae bacterium]
MLKISKLVIVTLFITLSNLCMYAQQAMVTSGGDQNGTGGSIAYSIGQPEYTNYTSDDGSISLGVQQPLIVIVGIEEPKITFAIDVFPNPATTSVHVNIDEFAIVSRGKYEYTLFGEDGKVLLHNTITGLSTDVSMIDFASGMYILQINQNNSEIKSFKIFKTN